MLLTNLRIQAATPTALLLTQTLQYVMYASPRLTIGTTAPKYVAHANLLTLMQLLVETGQ